MEKRPSFQTNVKPVGTGQGHQQNSVDKPSLTVKPSSTGVKPKK
ncbi:hypothetical protein ACPVTF_04105 [Geobacillus icigianus]|jgi:hypothetical protein|uniref:Uncharacterized protein n=1 Tax=Geobacillus subterraneus TaxID=129338 RepID=A0A679FQE1_9BACL|nr:MULTISPECIES: hypothetical protein [Geobacillus]BBW97239.1 hypothetical protein GsuE55_20720 [Geobacillus subterraneus]BBW99025.1 hypothetical protein GsuE55_38580 [Geobacillus subterraneus]